MDVEIHGARVGGALGGATLGAGVIAAEALARLRERRARIEAAALRVVLAIPRVLAPLTDTWRGDRDTSLGSEWSRMEEEVREDFITILTNARWPMRDAAKVRAAASERLARFTAAVDVYHQAGVPISVDVMLDVAGGGELVSAIAGRRSQMDVWEAADVHAHQERYKVMCEAKRRP